MSEESTPERCPEGCGRMLSGRRGQWELHRSVCRRKHSPHQRQWENQVPYWRWRWAPVNPDEQGPAVYVERTQATRREPPRFLVHLDVREGVFSAKLRATGAVEAQAEAEALFMSEWPEELWPVQKRSGAANRRGKSRVPAAHLP